MKRLHDQQYQSEYQIRLAEQNAFGLPLRVSKVASVLVESAFIFMCLALASHANANETLSTITVTAEEESTNTGDVQIEEHTGTHHRIEKADLERQDVNVGELISRESGVQFRKIGGLGTLTTLSLRAASSQQTGIYLDGILLNSAGNSTIDLSLFELLNVDSVDIYNGASPAQLSNGGIGGSVNLRTLSNKKSEPETRIAINAGSFNTNKLQFTHQSSHRNWDVVAAASVGESANDFEFINDNSTPLNPLDDRRQKRHNAKVEQVSALSRIGTQWSTTSRSDFLVQAITRDLGIPEWLNSDDNVASYDTDAVEMQFTHRIDEIGNWNNATTLFQHYQANHFLDRFADISLQRQDSKRNTVTRGVKTYWERLDDQGTLATSATLRSETLDASDAIETDQNFGVKRTTLLANAQYAWFSNNEKLLVTPALRFQSADDDYSGNIIRRDNSRNDAVFSPQLGVRYTFNETVSIQSNVGKFFRQPSFSELFGSRGLITANNKLKPEHGLNADIGITYKPSSRYTLRSTLFSSWRDEMIALAFDSQGVGRSINTGKANVFGIELSNDWKINTAFTAQLNTTWQQTNVFNANPAFNKNQIPGQADVVVHGRVKYTGKKLNAWIETNHKGDFFFGEANLLPSKPYWIHNLGVDWKWQKFKFSTTLSNLSNKNVEDFNRFPRPGRAIFFSLAYQI